MAEQITQETSINRSSNAFATVALVVGIVAAVLGWTGPFGLILAIVAIAFGVLGLAKKQSKVKSIWGIALGGVALITALIVISIAAAVVKVATDNGHPTVNGSSTPATNTPAIFKVGDAIDFDGKKVIVTNVERNWTSGNQYLAPETGNEFVKVQVSIENNSKAQISYNTYDWKMKNSQGVIKDIDSTTYSIDGALNSGDLAPAGKVTGAMIFQVPANDTGLVLSYNPSFFTDKKIEVKL